MGPLSYFLGPVGVPWFIVALSTIIVPTLSITGLIERKIGMKMNSIKLFVAMTLLAGLPSMSHASTAGRKVEFSVVSTPAGTAWLPAEVEVYAGETITFVVKHDLASGPEFHGFKISELNIEKQVNRGKPLSFDVVIGPDLGGKKLMVGCQFHPKHIGAELDVEKKAEKKAEKYR